MESGREVFQADGGGEEVALPAEAEVLGRHRLRQRKPIVQQLRDSHHLVARLFAVGLRSDQVATLAGYSQVRVRQFHSDPAFQELVAEYRKQKPVQDAIYGPLDILTQIVTENTIKFARHIADRLAEADETGESLPFKEALAGFADGADRIGFGKQNTQVNVNVDFAAQLDKAIRRTAQVKEIEAKANQPTQPNPPALAYSHLGGKVRRF